MLASLERWVANEANHIIVAAATSPTGRPFQTMSIDRVASAS